MQTSSCERNLYESCRRFTSSSAVAAIRVRDSDESSRRSGNSCHEGRSTGRGDKFQSSPGQMAPVTGEFEARAVE